MILQLFTSYIALIQSRVLTTVKYIGGTRLTYSSCVLMQPTLSIQDVLRLHLSECVGDSICPGCDCHAHFPPVFRPRLPCSYLAMSRSQVGSQAVAVTSPAKIMAAVA